MPAKTSAGSSAVHTWSADLRLITLNRISTSQISLTRSSIQPNRFRFTTAPQCSLDLRIFYTSSATSSTTIFGLLRHKSCSSAVIPSDTRSTTCLKPPTAEGITQMTTHLTGFLRHMQMGYLVGSSAAKLPCAKGSKLFVARGKHIP